MTGTSTIPSPFAREGQGEGEQNMKKIAISIIIIFLSASFAYSEDIDNCKVLFEELYGYTKKRHFIGI